VIWYAAQFYALFYLEKILKVDATTTDMLIAGALVIGTPMYLLFGWLSDKIGRKKIMMTGMALGLVTMNPLFHALTQAANPALAEASERAPVVVLADPASCSVQFDPVGKTRFDKTGCDIAKSALAKAGVPYANEGGPYGNRAVVKVGNRAMRVAPGAAPDIAAAIAAAGYPAKADPARTNIPLVIAILVALFVPVAMTYGPLAALLVELFPARIRYSALSLPYHVGNGWFGGFTPTIAFAIVAATGNIYAGLWYPIAVAAMTLVVGLLFLPETFRRPADHAD
jgi:MFS family permease